MILRVIVALCLSFGLAWAKEVPRPVLKIAKQAPVAEQPKPEAQQEQNAWPATDVAAGRKRCETLLKDLKLSYKIVAPIGGPGGCGAEAPILISAVNGVAIEPAAETSCELAEALNGWVTSSLQPAAREELHRDVSVISNASAYVCRRRNGQSTGKISEHAKANAMDIAWLRFSDGSSTTIKGDWSGILGPLGISAKAEFLGRIRREACVRFTTVLGPGSDSSHADHFHVDMARRKNGYRICQ
jgi:hypothetical protein